jgi:hypothetical protein
MASIWESSDRKLHKASLSAIKQFARENPETEVCCFFFDCDDPRYGHISISLDTLQNNLESAKQLEQFAIENRETMLKEESAWRSARYQLGHPVISAFNTNSGDFEFVEFADVEFPAWEKLAEKGNYPKGADHEDDYLESNARLVMWRVAERLVAEHAFQVLNLASPFILGYSIHDQEEVILRLINWPKGTCQSGAPCDSLVRSPAPSMPGCGNPRR